MSGKFNLSGATFYGCAIGKDAEGKGPSAIFFADGKKFTTKVDQKRKREEYKVQSDQDIDSIANECTEPIEIPEVRRIVKARIVRVFKSQREDHQNEDWFEKQILEKLVEIEKLQKEVTLGKISAFAFQDLVEAYEKSGAFELWLRLGWYKNRDEIVEDLLLKSKSELLAKIQSSDSFDDVARILLSESK